MPRSGGTYTRTHADYEAGAIIEEDDVNGELNDIGAEITNSVAVDGQSTMTGNLNMGTHKVTGVQAGTANTDAPNILQIQRQSVVHGTDNTVSPNTIIVACTPAITALVDGLRVSWRPLANNTGAATLNVGPGAVALNRLNSEALAANDVISTIPAVAVYSSASGVFYLQTAPPATLSILTTKGDLYAYTGSILVRQAAPANGGTLFGQTTQSNGWVAAAPWKGWIQGWSYANNSGDATNDIDISDGAGMDATGAYPLVGAAMTKRSDANWSVGTGQGALDTGAVGNSDYYIWAIGRSDTVVVDYLFSLSSTAPTMPANYDFKRLIGWFKRSGGSIVAFRAYEMAGGGLQFLWSSPTLDVNLAATLTTSRRTDAVKVPQDISTLALLNVTINDASAAWNARIACPDLTDLAPGDATTAPLATMRGQAAVAEAAFLAVQTSSTGLIAARADLATVDQYSVATEGFIWSRR